MAAIELRDLSFTYPLQSRPALEHVSLTVEAGDFLVLCGPSGCGKSTLLRQLKTVLAPHGARSGAILIQGEPLDSLDLRAQSETVGFVQQSPDNQLVTDKVWHELAFGLESLGYDTPTIRRRVAEMASFFGIQTWFHREVSQLSGGQKQLLNLAAVMVMQPRILVLDEPTSQLDPIAAADFLATLGKINRELGTTVILTEHRLEDALPQATRAAAMDGGRLIACGTPAQVGEALQGAGHRMFLAMPTPMRVWAAAGGQGDCPITVREGRRWLEAFAQNNPLRPLPPAETQPPVGDAVLSAEEVWFRYEPQGPDVVRGLSLELRRGELLALLGGNGTGKSTSLRLLAGISKPQRGTITCRGTVGVLPQDPQTLFVKKTVREDLFEMLPKNTDRREERVARVAALCQLEELLDRHPYDLSGGEQQRAALAKILLLEPDILLLDEPTKGLDAAFKEGFAQILRQLQAEGRAILMVSHDVEFCARNAGRCALFFDGGIVTQGPARAFFSGNSFYTTAADRMGRSVCPGAVTAEDLMAVCGGEVPARPPLREDIPPLPPPAPETADWKPQKLPRWRRALAAVSGGAALAIFAYALSVTDLSQVVGPQGLTALSRSQAALYGGLILALFVFAAAVSRKSALPPAVLQIPKEKRKLGKRTAAAMGLILLLIPLTLFVGVTYLGGRKYYFIALLILLEAMLPFFLVFEGRKPQARELVVIAVLCALTVAGRAMFFMLPEFKPVVAMTILAGVAFGGETGFLVGSMSMLVSNILFSQGPWTPWQMFAMGIIGFLAGVLYRRGLLRRSRGSLCIFGALVSVVVYGGIMNPASAIMWTGTLDGKTLLTYYLTGVPVDLVRGAATALFLWIGGEPLLEKLDRIKVKYGLVE